MKRSLRFAACLPGVLLTMIAILLAGSLFLTERASAGALDTPTFSIPLIVNEHDYWSYGLNFGIHPSATTGIDPALGEVEYPPLPIGGGFPLWSTAGGNAVLDLRPYTGPTQVETYVIRIALDESDTSLFPMTFSWPNLSPYYSGPVHLKSDISGSYFDIDMMSQTSYTMLHYPGDPAMQVWSVYVVATGPLPGTTLPVVSTVGLAVGGFQSIVHAPPAAAAAAHAVMGTATGTSTWFEYGPTRLYGTTTAPQGIADGVSAAVSSPYDASSLPPNSRLHFRAVAQTTGGVFYGEDQIISNGAPPPEDTSGFVKYRTALYHDWADAKDAKAKRKSVKCSPDKVAFDFSLSWIQGAPNPPDSVALWVKFSMATSGSISGLRCEYPNLIPYDSMFSWEGSKEFIVHLAGGRTGIITDPLCATNPTISIHGLAPKAKMVKMSYQWRALDGTPMGLKSSLPGHPDLPSDNIAEMDYLLPMPNLHNVGEGIYGGVKQTAVNIIIGITDDPKGAHTVYHPKYKDVLKSLVKEQKAGDLYHTRQWLCLDQFDKNHAPISKAQKSLPPDKHNNLLFAEQLTLKLNIMASDSGMFPKGLGDLLYSNGTSFDNLTLRTIEVYTDSFLACPATPPHGEGDPAVYIKVLQDINSAFAGPMDTTSWSCAKVVCTGVKMLMDVPYLHANPGAIPFAAAPQPHYAMDLGPDRFALQQNYPNPFNPTTTISFGLQREALVTLSVYNTLGQRVAELIHAQLMDAGDQEVEFDASSLASGVYFYSIVAQNPEGSALLFSTTKKMLLIK